MEFVCVFIFHEILLNFNKGIINEELLRRNVTASFGVLYIVLNWSCYVY